VSPPESPRPPVVPPRTAAWLAAAPDLAIAAAALLTWWRPEILGVDLVRWFLMLMLVEFIVVHSTGFLGGIAYSDESAARRLRGTIYVSGFYTLFLAGIALGLKSWWPIIAFWSLTFNRLLGTMIGQVDRGREREFIQRGWAASVAFYLLAIFPTVILPLPRLGITRSVRDGLELPGEGLWITDPHRVVAFAMVYFALMASSELSGHGWVKQKGGAPPAA
jgi:hypothetical protein